MYKNNFVEDEESEKEISAEDSIEKTSYENKYKKYLYIKYIVYSSPKKLPNNDYLINSISVQHSSQ